MGLRDPKQESQNRKQGAGNGDADGRAAPLRVGRSVLNFIEQPGCHVSTSLSTGPSWATDRVGSGHSPAGCIGNTIDPLTMLSLVLRDVGVASS